jgi:Tol biopolymer transport system component
MMPQAAHVASNRPFRQAGLSALAVLALSASVQAAPPVLIFEQLTVTSGADCGNFYPSMNAAVTKVAFTSFCDLTGQNPDHNAEVFVMNADGTNVHQVTQTVSNPGFFGAQNVGLNANGTVVVFSSDGDLVPGGNTDGNFEIFTINVDGTGITQLTHSTGGDPANFGGSSHPSFSPFGSQILFASDRDLIPGGNADDNQELFLMNADGSGLVQITHTVGGFGNWDGSLASGGRVLFTSDIELVPGGNPDGNSELYTINVDGTGLQQITHTTGGDNVAPRWTANGMTLTFRSDADLVGNNPDHGLEVFRMDTDGSHLAQVTSSASASGFSAPWDIGLNGKVIAIESDQDLVPGSNADHNFEIFLAILVP